MKRRDFFTKGFAALSLLTVPVIIRESSKPKEFLNDDDVHEMLSGRKAIVERDIVLTRTLYLENYELPVMIRNKIILCEGMGVGIRTGKKAYVFTGNYIQTPEAKQPTIGWNNVFDSLGDISLFEV